MVVAISAGLSLSKSIALLATEFAQNLGKYLFLKHADFWGIILVSRKPATTPPSNIMSEQKKFTLGELESEQHLYNEEVFEQIVRQYRRRMMKFCGSKFPVIDSLKAEDLIHDVFTELLEAVAKGIRKKEVPVDAWIFQCLGRLCQNEARKMRRENALTDEESEGYNIDSPSSEPSPLARLENEEFRQCLVECFKRLKPSHRKVIELWLKGWKQTEIAKELNISNVRVYAMIHHQACPQLRKCLEEYGFNQEDLNQLL